MLKFQWNALRLGHRVTVHDPATPGAGPTPGTVVMIETAVARKGAAGVGIRVTDDTGTTTVRWPSYLTVHLDPDDGTEPCWRCDEIAARG